MSKRKMDLSRPLSWSSLSLFAGLGGYPADPEEWYRRYVLKIQSKPTKEMLFGSAVDIRIQKDPEFLPQLPRYPIMQHPMAVVFDNIPLIGYADGFDRANPMVVDYKTGKAPWTQKKADETGQLTMYAMMNFIQEKIAPKDCKFRIHWIQTQDNGDFTISLVEPVVIHTFETKRRMADILKFGQEIKRIFTEMQKYVEDHE